MGMADKQRYRRCQNEELDDGFKALYAKSADMVVESAEYITYPRRWYILAIYSLNASLQACIFNTYGPIAQSAKLAFCWSDAVVAWMGNMMLLVGIVAVPLSYSIINSL